MTEINLHHKNAPIPNQVPNKQLAGPSLSSFYLEASKLGNDSTKTIKLGGAGVKSVGWTTWKSTNRKTMAAFLNAIKDQFDDTISAAISKRYSLNPSTGNVPLTARTIKNIERELTELARQRAMDNAFSETAEGKISTAQSFANALVVVEKTKHAFNATKEGLKTLPDIVFENMKKSCLLNAKQCLQADKGISEKTINDRLSEETQKTVSSMTKNLEQTYRSLKIDEHQSSEIICKHLGATYLPNASAYMNYGKILCEMATKGQISNDEIAQEMREWYEATQIYNEVCNQAGVPPQMLDNGTPLSIIYENISKTVMMLGPKNNELANVLQRQLDLLEGKTDKKLAPCERMSLSHDHLRVCEAMTKMHPEIKDFIKSLAEAFDNMLLPGKTKNNKFKDVLPIIKDCISRTIAHLQTAPTFVDEKEKLQFIANEYFKILEEKEIIGSYTESMQKQLDRLLEQAAIKSYGSGVISQIDLESLIGKKSVENTNNVFNYEPYRQQAEAAMTELDKFSGVDNCRNLLDPNTDASKAFANAIKAQNALAARLYLILQSGNLQGDSEAISALHQQCKNRAMAIQGLASELQQLVSKHELNDNEKARLSRKASELLATKKGSLLGVQQAMDKLKVMMKPLLKRLAPLLDNPTQKTQLDLESVRAEIQSIKLALEDAAENGLDIGNGTTRLNVDSSMLKNLSAILDQELKKIQN